MTCSLRRQLAVLVASLFAVLAGSPPLASSEWRLVESPELSSPAHDGSECQPATPSVNETPDVPEAPQNLALEPTPWLAGAPPAEPSALLPLGPVAHARPGARSLPPSARAPPSTRLVG
ncbi:MAG: hypothetical protein OZ921_01140 [Sorangiineae bacterium]|nr:hypothetical protein [Polyangiaceae bacterium]MEB2321089.1 hypothetical protein [Sorangiineae bacterium]